MASADKNDNVASDGFLSHLIELRGTLLRSISALFILFLCILPFSGHLYTVLAAPLISELAGSNSELIAIGVITPFIIHITTSFFFALWIGLPYIFYEVWKFVAPGLYKNEKQLVLPILVSTTLLFSIGIFFSYFLVFKVVFSFIATVTPDGVKWSPDVLEYFSFIVKVFIGFGLAFETPIVVYMLIRLGIVSIEAMRRARPYVIVGAFAVAAIITPPDVISQLLLAIPCCLLYELGLLIAPKTPKSSTPPNSDNGDDDPTDDPKTPPNITDKK